MNIMYLTLSIILPLVLNLIFTPIIISYANKKQLFDKKDHRKTHEGNIPRLGGIGIFSAMVISAISIYILTGRSETPAFYIAISLIFITGIVDDVKPIRAIVKLLTQIAASLILVVGGHTISHILVPFTDINIYLGYFKYPITFLWVIGVTNALNLLDGMDGQAGGVGVIASISMGLIAMFLGQSEIAITCFILAGAILAFLTFNFPPAKIFMGDSGSLMLGFFLASIPLLFTTPEYRGKMIYVGVAVLLIPILDVFAAIIRRRRKKISFFIPDRGHIHHKFIDFTSLSTKQILARIYFCTAISGLLSGLFILYTNIYTTFGLIFNFILHLVLFNFLHQRKKRDSDCK